MPLIGLVLEDEGHAVSFNQENKFGRQQCGCSNFPLPAGAAMARRVFEGFDRTQSIRWKNKTENCSCSLGGTHTFPPTQDTRPVAVNTCSTLAASWTSDWWGFRLRLLRSILVQLSNSLSCYDHLIKYFLESLKQIYTHMRIFYQPVWMCIISFLLPNCSC